MKRKTAGITLIETVVAISILTIGVASIVGTALYTFSTYNRTLLRLTALNLARESVEVVRNIRDTNWLPPNAIEYCGTEGEAGYIANDQYCYKNWLQSLDNCGLGCKAVFRPENNTWELQPGSDYALYKNAVGADFAVFTDQDNGTNPIFFRKLKIIKNTVSNPYTNEHPELQIISIVAWLGRGCFADFSGDPENAQNHCKIVVEDRFTNWKDY